MLTELPDDDDAIADRIAEEVVSAIPAHYSPEFRAKLVSLYVRQLLGIEPSRATQRALAETFGVTPQRIGEIECTALARLYRRHHHTLRDEL